MVNGRLAPGWPMIYADFVHFFLSFEGPPGCCPARALVFLESFCLLGRYRPEITGPSAGANGVIRILRRQASRRPPPLPE
jgi:hypothetical protein